RIGSAQTEHGAQQHGFAHAGTTDHGEDFAAMKIQIQVFVHHVGAEAVAQVTYANHDVVVMPGLVRRRRHQPISVKNSATSASIAISRKIDCTTLDVVCSPTERVLPWTLKPSRQPIIAIRKPKKGALPIP